MRPAIWPVVVSSITIFVQWTEAASTVAEMHCWHRAPDSRRGQIAVSVVLRKTLAQRLTDSLRQVFQQTVELDEIVHAT